MREYSSSTRGSITSARVWRESIRGGRSPTPATSIIWPASASCLSAQPWWTLSSSASVVGVRSAIAMSLVIWSPAIGTTAVWRIAPSRKTAISLVPPPISTRQTPSSFSSSVRTASEEASGCRIRSLTSSPQRRTHLTMFWAADTAPVTMCTFTSRRTPLMPSGSRTPSWPSMMNSWVRMCSTCWSVGMGIARAVSMERSTSVCVTSLSLIATIPVESKLLIWLPAIPVKTRSILQSAMSSASSSVRWIALTVDSMFTTTPFFRPLDSCAPMPTMSMRASGKSSATIATTLDVPMSRATMRFLFSLGMSDFLVRKPQGLRPRGVGDPPGQAQGEAAGVAQIDVVEALPRLGERLRERRDEARQSVLDAVLLRVAPELDGEAVRKLELPGKARAEEHLPGLEAEGSEQVPESKVAARDLAFGARRAREHRERGVALPAEQLPLRVHELRLSSLLAPARERHLLLDAHFQAVGPAATQLCAAYPGDVLEECAHRFQIHREKRAPHAPLQSVDDFAALDAHEVSLDDDRLEQERGRVEEHASPGVREEREGERGKHARGRVHDARAIPHGPPPSRAAPIRGCAGTGPRTTTRRGAPPWARASGRSSRARCSPRGNRACPSGPASGRRDPSRCNPER